MAIYSADIKPLMSKSDGFHRKRSRRFRGRYLKRNVESVTLIFVQRLKSSKLHGENLTLSLTSTLQSKMRNFYVDILGYPFKHSNPKLSEYEAGVRHSFRSTFKCYE
jgi:hypothetical protein